jgi:hypothetical protein
MRGPSTYPTLRPTTHSSIHPTEVSITLTTTTLFVSLRVEDTMNETTKMLFEETTYYFLSELEMGPEGVYVEIQNVFVNN